MKPKPGVVWCIQRMTYTDIRWEFVRTAKLNEETLAVREAFEADVNYSGWQHRAWPYYPEKEKRK